MASVTRLGDLWNFLVTNFLKKLAILGYFKNINLQVKHALTTFGKFRILFISASGHTGLGAL